VEFEIALLRDCMAARYAAHVSACHGGNTQLLLGRVKFK
jgi:hypothetical protein